MPNRHSSGRGTLSERQPASVSGRFFSGLVRPIASSMSSRRGMSARGQSVEVLEDVSVPAADARVLGDVHDAYGPARASAREAGCARAVAGAGVDLTRVGGYRARVEELRPAFPERALGAELALALH